MSFRAALRYAYGQVFGNVGAEFENLYNLEDDVACNIGAGGSEAKIVKVQIHVTYPQGKLKC